MPCCARLPRLSVFEAELVGCAHSCLLRPRGVSELVAPRVGHVKGVVVIPIGGGLARLILQGVDEARWRATVVRVIVLAVLHKIEVQVIPVTDVDFWGALREDV